VSRLQPRGTATSNDERVATPLFILSPPRSFSSIVCAMIGQHPQMYALPETHLFGAETVGQWWAQCSVASHTMDHGVLRATAELCFGDQTEETITLARGWLHRRAHFSTGYLLEQFARRVLPKRLVDKSPSLVYSPASLRRVLDVFPRARFIHLVRHPRGQGESVMRRIELAERRREVPQWMIDLASFPTVPGAAPVTGKGELDPQGGWYVLNHNICDFLQSVPDDQWIRIQGENLISDPDPVLRDICTWMELRTDSRAIEQMKHPEASPYSRLGPPGAELGNDPLFLHKPNLRSTRAEQHTLEGPLGWRMDGGGFSPVVKDLARRFGYQ
jgi:Sulfotransferase family